jgi:UDP-2,3-diacylglucosamine hydrolase
MHYFVSDIHLGSGTPEEQRRVERSFLDFLTKIEEDAETLLLVGDIFDFWFEYKRVVPKGFVRVLGRLAELSDNGVRVVMLTGNHDMWVGDYLTKECGVELYTKPQTFTLAGKTLFVAHGDNMNIGDKPILCLMNAMFRSKVLRKVASWLIHPDLFMRFGQWWSGKSRKSHGVQSSRVLNPLIDYAVEHNKSHKVDYYIFGHLHFVADIKGPIRLLFMGDWHTQPSYVALDNNGEIELKYYKKLMADGQ